MKVAVLVPGSGGSFYCENCARDLTLVRALRAAGHDAFHVPLYLPVALGEPAAHRAPLFFGGVNAWLQQHVPLFRVTPRWVDALLDAPALLRAAGRRAGTTRASSLGPMTLSMLAGEEGRQAKELRRLAAWVAAERPRVVHLSNALLLGAAPLLRAAAGCAVVCSLQDEAPWVESMGEPWSGRVFDAMRAKGAFADAFVASSRAYGQAMAARLAIPPGKLHVVHDSVDADAFPRAPLTFDPPAVGFLARMCAGSGLELLVEAFLALREERRLEGLRLRLCGGSTADDAPFLAGIRRRLADRGALGALEVEERLDGPSRAAFLSSLSAFSVPGTRETAAGLGVVEAMAAGVPVVQPAVGAYPELLALAGGGSLCDPGDPAALAAGLRAFLLDPPLARETGRRGREGVREHLSLPAMGRRMDHVYRAALPPRGTA